MVSPVSAIGSLRETPFHAALKRHVAPPGAAFEVGVGGYVIDVVAPGLLIEVQTRSVGKLKTKLAALLPEHRLRLVIPLAENRWIERCYQNGERTRRRSPKHAGYLHLFSELVGIADVLAHPNLEIETVMTDQLELREHVPGKAWRRRGWVVTGRELLQVNERRLFRDPAELGRLLPALPETFTSRELALAAKVPARLAGQTVYTLSRAGELERVGKAGNAYLYRRLPAAAMPERSRAASSSATSGSTMEPERR